MLFNEALLYCIKVSIAVGILTLTAFLLHWAFESLTRRIGQLWHYTAYYMWKTSKSRPRVWLCPECRGSIVSEESSERGKLETWNYEVVQAVSAKSKIVALTPMGVERLRGLHNKTRDIEGVIHQMDTSSQNRQYLRAVHLFIQSLLQNPITVQLPKQVDLNCCSETIEVQKTDGSGSQLVCLIQQAAECEANYADELLGELDDVQNKVEDLQRELSVARTEMVQSFTEKTKLIDEVEILKERAGRLQAEESSRRSERDSAEALLKRADQMIGALLKVPKGESVLNVVDASTLNRLLFELEHYKYSRNKD